MSSPPRCVSPLVAMHFEDAVVQLEDGNVEGAAAEVVDGDDAVLLRDRVRKPAPPRSAH